MKLLDCYIRQFGTLRDRSFTFDDGITLISGKNESGKSTLHTAFAALLFGMEKGKGRAARGGIYRANLPWSEPDLYGGRIRWEREGKTVSAERDFSRTPPASRLTLNEQGKERTISPEEVPFPDGLSPYIFANTLSFRQIGAATGNGLAADLKTHIMNLKSSGDENFNVYAAIEQLKTQRKALEKRIDPGAQAEDDALAMKMAALEERSLTGGADYDALKAQADAQDARIRALTADREKTDRSLRAKEALLTGMGTTSRETVESDQKRAATLCEQLSLYQRDYAGKHAVSSGALGPLSILMIVLTLGAFLLMNRIFQTGANLLFMLPLFLAALFAATFFTRITRRQDADAGNAKNTELLKTMLARYLPNYQAQGTLAEAEETKAYLEKVLQLFDYLEEKRKRFEADTEELATLSASREALNSALNEQLAAKLEREQWEPEMRALMERRDALQPILQENDRLRSEIAAIARASSALSLLADNAADRFGVPLTKTASGIFREITKGAYDGLEVSDDLELFALSAGRKIAPGALSAGAMEQLYFSFRLAVVRLLWPKEDMPLFFDDSFAMYDSERLEACLNWLHTNYHGQVFLFSCQDREKKTLDKLGIAYHSVEL